MINFPHAKFQEAKGKSQCEYLAFQWDRNEIIMDK